MSLVALDVPMEMLSPVYYGIIIDYFRHRQTTVRIENRLSRGL